jgi:hypothetical protein
MLAFNSRQSLADRCGATGLAAGLGVHKNRAHQKPSSCPLEHDNEADVMVLSEWLPLSLASIYIDPNQHPNASEMFHGKNSAR